MASDPTSPASALALLRGNPDYRRLFLATVVSMLGDWFAFVAISGFVTEATGHASASAAVYAASVLPASVLSPVAGLLADRLDRQRLMIAVDLLRVVPALGLLAALRWHAPGLALGCVALLAALSAFFDPVAEASVPNVVAPEDLPVAQAALGSVWGSMLFVGAALGGLATLAFGREASILLNAATFLLSAGLVSGIRSAFQQAVPADAPANGSDAGHPLGEALAFTRQHPVCLALLTTKVGVGLGNGLVGLLPAFAARNFGYGDEGVGLLLSARGLGALIGPWLGQHWVRGEDRRLFLGLVAASVTVCPGAENPIALDRRLNRTCRTRFASALKLPISGSATICRLSEASASRSCTPSAALRIVSSTSMRFRCSSSTPVSIVARSRMSLMIASSAAEDFIT